MYVCPPWKCANRTHPVGRRALHKALCCSRPSMMVRYPHTPCKMAGNTPQQCSPHPRQRITTQHTLSTAVDSSHPGNKTVADNTAPTVGCFWSWAPMQSAPRTVHRVMPQPLTLGKGPSGTPQHHAQIIGATSRVEPRRWREYSDHGFCLATVTILPRHVGTCISWHSESITRRTPNPPNTHTVPEWHSGTHGHTCTHMPTTNTAGMIRAGRYPDKCHIQPITHTTLTNTTLTHQQTPRLNHTLCNHCTLQVTRGVTLLACLLPHQHQ